MRKYTLNAIIQFVGSLLLAAAIALGWAAYAYDDMPLVSAICFTIVDVILLLFNAIEYVIAITYYREKLDEKEVEE